MDWFVKAFIKSSVAWLAAGITLGVAMALYPQWTVYRPAHLHMNVAGFVAMMIFGVAYHVVPRFVGVPLYSRRAAGAHVFLANFGLAGMVAGFMLRPHGVGPSGVLLAVGGILMSIGGYTFAYLLWRTIDGAPRALAAARERASNTTRPRVVLPTAPSQQ